MILRFLRSKKPSTIPDEEVIQSFRKTENSLFIGILFDRYSHLVYGVSYNYLKDEEACKDTVLHIFENLSRDLIKYEIKNFSSWLHVVTKNYCLRELSKRKDIIPLTFDTIQEQNEEEEINIAEIHLPNLSHAIHKLNEDQRICIDMFYLREMSYKEITEQTGYNLNQVKSHIQNGKRNLKLILLKKK